MKKYLVLYKAPADTTAQLGEMTPEQQEEGMNAWMNWAKSCGDQLVDLGQPLANGLSVSPQGSNAADGQVAGYSILQAESKEAAEKLLQGHPHLAWHPTCTIELHEAQPIPGM